MSGIVKSIAVSSTRQHTEFARGTKMVFNQTASPTGWTKVTGSGDDHALRLTTGTVGTGGDVNFETAFADKTFTPTISQPTASLGAVTSHSLTYAQLPNVVGKTQSGQYRVSAGSYQSGADQNIGTGDNTVAGTASAHPHGFTQPTISIPTSNAVPIDINVKFVDVIIATKD
jgi:hypothetical protein